MSTETLKPTWLDNVAPRVRDAREGIVRAAASATATDFAEVAAAIPVALARIAKASAADQHRMQGLRASRDLAFHIQSMSSAGASLYKRLEYEARAGAGEIASKVVDEASSLRPLAAYLLLHPPAQVVVEGEDDDEFYGTPLQRLTRRIR